MAREKAVVVGAGSISGAWFGPLAAEKVEVAGVVDLDPGAARARIEQFGLDCPASTDLVKTLKRTQPDFVVDLTVPEAHCKVTCTALAHGCHVIGEKPMASSMAEARRMVRAADKAGRCYMVSQSRRWDAKHEVVRRVVAGRKLGRLTTINCDFYIPAHFAGFRVKMASPLILDMAIHQFDLARYFTGADPKAVYAHEFNPPGSWYAGDAAASCIFEMSDGIVFTFRGSWCAEGCLTSWNGNWRIIGEKGTLLYENDRTPVAQVAGSKKAFFRGTRDVKIPAGRLKYPGQHGALREMLAYLRRCKMPQCECHDNIKSLAMVFAAMDSSRKRRRVVIVD